jgi:hypothetical protein
MSSCKVRDIPAVVPISTVDISSSPINPDLLVESLVMHVHIEIRSGLLSASISRESPIRPVVCKEQGPFSGMDERRRTHVVLPELDTSSMSLNNLLNQIGNSRLILESTRVIPFNPSIIRRESTLDGILQDGETVRTHFSVILDILNEPPWTISTIVSRVSGRVEQVGDKTVLEGGSECEDMISSSGEVSSGKE